MNDNLGKGIKKARNSKLEMIVGIWTVVVIVLLIGSVSFALVKLNSKDETKKDIAKVATEPAIAVETASPSAVSASESAVSGPVDETDIYANKYAYTTDVVNVRSDASTISRIITKLQVGCQVEVSKKYNEEWAEILINGQKGYVMAKYLSPVKPENVTTPTTAPSQAPVATKNPNSATSTPRPTSSATTKPSPSTKPKASSTPKPSATPKPSKKPVVSDKPDVTQPTTSPTGDSEGNGDNSGANE